MMNYTYYPDMDDKDCLLWHVYENGTEQIISSFFFEDDAREFMQFLEAGGGFSGFTPSFMLRKSQIGNINDAFVAEFSE